MKKIYEVCTLYPTTYAVLKSCGITSATSGIEKTLIRSSAELINPCIGFNHTWDQLINMIYYLVKEGHFSMHDLLYTDWFFVDLLYNTLYEEIKQKNKQQEEENRRQEQEMAKYQNMQDYQNKMMDNMNNFNLNNFNY